MSRTMIVLLAALAISVVCADAFGQRLECTRENEEYKCGSACQTTCENYGQFCPIVNVVCNDACYCKEGYARITDYNSSCIPVENCP